jgi:hypothetical protein
VALVAPPSVGGHQVNYRVSDAVPVSGPVHVEHYLPSIRMAASHRRKPRSRQRVAFHAAPTLAPSKGTAGAAPVAASRRTGRKDRTQLHDALLSRGPIAKTGATLRSVRKKLQGRVRGAAGDLPAEADERLAAARPTVSAQGPPARGPLALTHQRHWLCTAAMVLMSVSPYQSTRLSRYNAVSPELGSGYSRSPTR